MKKIGIREFRRNASSVVAEAASGKEFVITDRGRPVARMAAVPVSPLQGLIDAGLARPARRSIVELPAPTEGEGLSAVLSDTRDAERF